VGSEELRLQIASGFGKIEALLESKCGLSRIPNPPQEESPMTSLTQERAASIRRMAGKREQIDAPRKFPIPADLEAALAKAHVEAKIFAALPHSHKQEYIEWIESAKKKETRASRIEKTLAMLASHKTPKA
jgi:uncharacterized protein YdeI (YjbR/CyaY-like superfamily)